MRSTAAALLLSLLPFPAFAAVTGTIMTSDGAAVSGARVSLYAIESQDARRARLLSDKPEAVPLATAQTDAKGNFTFESPKDATIDLRVFAKGYEPVSRTIEHDEDAGAIALRKSETRGGAITAAGKPVANALVAISYGGAEYVTRTDERGRYEAPDLKSARSVIVIHPDFAISEDTPMTTNARTFDRTLSPGVTISGRTMNSDGSAAVAKALVSVDGWPLATSGRWPAPARA